MIYFLHATVTEGGRKEVKVLGRLEAVWQLWSRARHGYVVNRRPLAGVQPPRGQAPFEREEPREAVQLFGISEGLSGLTWTCNQTLICGAMRKYA